MCGVWGAGCACVCLWVNCAYFINRNTGVGEMTLGSKVFAAKAYDLSSVLRTHTGKENRCLQAASDVHMCAIHFSEEINIIKRKFLIYF